MLTFNEIKSALISDKHIPSRVNLTLNGVNVPISGVRMASESIIICIPVDKNTTQIQLTPDHTITILS